MTERSEWMTGYNAGWEDALPTVLRHLGYSDEAIATVISELRADMTKHTGLWTPPKEGTHPLPVVD